MKVHGPVRNQWVRKKLLEVAGKLRMDAVLTARREIDR